MKKSLFYVLFVLIVSLVIPTNLVAECKCGKAKSIDESYKESDLVFLGQVVSVNKATVLHEGYKVIKMITTIPYKGSEILPATEYVTIYTEVGACGIEFVRQNDYLIFAKGEPAFLTTSICNLTEIQETSREKQIRVEKLSKGE